MIFPLSFFLFHFADLARSTFFRPLVHFCVDFGQHISVL